MIRIAPPTIPVPKADTPAKAGVAAPGSETDAGLKKAARQFESYFMDTLMKEMRKTLPKDTLLGDDSHGQEIFQDMMDQTFADAGAARGDFGIGALIYRQLAPKVTPAAAAKKSDEKDSTVTGKDAISTQAAADPCR